ncbi:MAG: hypothetical protein ACKPKO_36280, partial [Candidatus Fonsibacter sp.]
SRKIQNDLKTYYLDSYIYMENATTTTTETISEEATAKQKRIEKLRKYNRDYYHAHKKASECEHCKKTCSSVSALRRHQGKQNLKCKLLQATETIDKFREKADK